MPPPTTHTPFGADLGGPVIVAVTLVTVPLSNNRAKTAAKPSGTCPITLPSVSSITFNAASLCVGTYIHWVLVIDGYLYSRVYGMYNKLSIIL